MELRRRGARVARGHVADQRAGRDHPHLRRPRQHDVGRAQLGLELVADHPGVVRLAEDGHLERVARVGVEVGGRGAGIAAALAQRQLRAADAVVAQKPAGSAAGPVAQHVADVELAHRVRRAGDGDGRALDGRFLGNVARGIGHRRGRARERRARNEENAARVLEHDDVLQRAARGVGGGHARQRGDEHVVDLVGRHLRRRAQVCKLEDVRAVGVGAAAGVGHVGGRAPARAGIGSDE